MFEFEEAQLTRKPQCATCDDVCETYFVVGVDIIIIAGKESIVKFGGQCKLRTLRKVTTL
jgi:hypothetical protein